MNEEKRKFNWKKLAWSALGIFVALNVAMILIGMNGDRIVQWMANRQYQGTMETYAKEAARIKALEMADAYGSTTPEGTLELLIAALEGGDIQLASKYHHVTQQQNSFRILQERKNSKKLDEVIQKYIQSKEGKWTCENARQCTLVFTQIFEQDTRLNTIDGKSVVIPKGEKIDSVIRLELNSSTNLWKVKE